jgi:hypothetical protein
VETEAENLIFKEVQKESFPELANVSSKRKLPKSNRLVNLDPFIEESALMRVGGDFVMPKYQLTNVIR